MNHKHSPIFITGRFRSGTSFLWQLFDAMEDYCAWYEPLHPQLLAAIDSVKPKQDHVGIDDYWAVYRRYPEFRQTYSSELGSRYLYLDTRSEYPALKQHIENLIKLSGSKVPVLQFNRVDLRLPWLRKHFPTAKIIHIERNPLQLYRSQRKHIDSEFQDSAGYWDAYELMPWCHALFKDFPFLLDTKHSHAFYPFYGLYQLSKIIASRHADITINLDTDVFHSIGFIEKIKQVVPLSSQQQATMVLQSQVPELAEFDNQTSEEMAQIMTVIDLHLFASGLFENLGQRTLQSIKLHHGEYWDNWTDGTCPWQQVKDIVMDLQQEVMRIENENIEFANRIDAQDVEAPKRRSDCIELMDKDQINQHSDAGQLMNHINQLQSIMTYLLADNQALRAQLPEDVENKSTDAGATAEHTEKDQPS